MTPTLEETALYRPGDVHPFLAAETPFLYLVETGGIVDLTPTAAAAFALLRDRAATRDEVARYLVSRGHGLDEVNEALDELDQFGAIVSRERGPAPVQEPAENFPLQTMVLNLTNQCNLSCG